MRSYKILLILFVGVLCLYAPQTLALKQIVYPDATTLQPMPDESLPNISGNIDWPNNVINPEVPAADNQSGTNNDQISASGTNISNPATSVVNNTQNNGAPSANSRTDSPVNPTAPAAPGTTVSPNASKNNAGGTKNTQSQTDQNFNPANPFSYFDSNPTSVQENAQKQNIATENSDTTVNSAVDQNTTSEQKAALWSFYVQIIVLSLVALLVIIFIIWRLTKSSNK
jgi:hypothetical protein